MTLLSHTSVLLSVVKDIVVRDYRVLDKSSVCVCVVCVFAR